MEQHEGILTYVRHLAAVVAGGIAATIAGWIGMDADAQVTLAGQLTETLTTIGAAVWLAVYTVVEKGLKRFTGGE